MTFESNQQFWDAITTTAKKLEQIGLERESKSLQGALCCSSSTTEIFGEVGITLAPLTVDAQLPGDLREEISEEFETIVKILPGMNRYRPTSAERIN